jgi:sugar O-acyltransferase (sialic acid O-acetyltransferase NeuD family)
MSKLLIIGAGGHGRMVADMAASTESWSSIAFLDDEAREPESALPWPVLGPCDLVESMSDDYDSIALGFGDNVLRYRWSERVSALSLDLATIVSPEGIVSDHAELGPGTVVMPGAVVNIGVTTGRGVIVNTGATVDHDCRLAHASHVGPGANLGGGVLVGERTLVGVGAAVRNGVRIGCDVTVGVGAAVHADLPDECTAVGVPARPLR